MTEITYEEAYKDGVENAVEAMVFHEADCECELCVRVNEVTKEIIKCIQEIQEIQKEQGIQEILEDRPAAERMGAESGAGSAFLDARGGPARSMTECKCNCHRCVPPGVAARSSYSLESNAGD